MQLYRIRDYSAGIMADIDSLDAPENSVFSMSNMIVWPGLIKNRQGCANLEATGFTALKSFAEFYILQYGSTYSRFLLIKDQYALKKSIYSAGYGVPSSSLGINDYNGLSNVAEITRFINIKNNIYGIRGGFDYQLLNYWYGYIYNRPFFNNYVTFNNWYLVYAYIPFPYGIATLFDGGTGTMAGRYFVRYTYQYDGYQETGWEGDYTTNEHYHDLTGAEGYVAIQLDLHYPLNRRITGINIYIAWASLSGGGPFGVNPTAPDTGWYHAGFISINHGLWESLYADTGKNTKNDATGAIDNVTDPVTFVMQDSAHGLEVDNYIRIDTEILRLTVVAGATLTAARAQKGTTKAAHVQNTDVYEVVFRITAEIYGTSVSFPDTHYSLLHTGAVYGYLNSAFTEELYLRLNHVVGSVSHQLTCENYSDAVWLNQRLFIIQPADNSQVVFPYDKRQVVLFSQIDKPDVIHLVTDYMDFSTPEGDECMRIAQLNGDLYVFKKYNTFRISMFNSGDSLSWAINEHYQKIGCALKNGLTAGNGLIFVPGYDNIYLFDGQRAIPITMDKQKTIYLNYLADVTDSNTVIGLFDPLNNQFRLLFSEEAGMMVYDVTRQCWLNHVFNDVINHYDPAYIALNNDLNLLGANNTRIMQIEKSGSSSEAFTASYTSHWLDVNGNPYQEKRIKFIKAYINNDADATMTIYKDYGVSATKTLTVSSSRTDKPYYYTECSFQAKVIKIIISQSCASGNDIEVRDIEVGYEPLEDR